MFTQAFIRIISFHKEGDGPLLEAAVFDNCRKNLEMFKFSSDEGHIDIVNGCIF